MPEDALVLDGVSFRDAAGSLRLDGVTVIVKPGEIVGVAGVEGNGQAELGLILAGLARPSEGRVFVGGRNLTGRSPGEITAAGVGIIPEDRHARGLHRRDERGREPVPGPAAPLHAVGAPAPEGAELGAPPT